MIFSSKLITFVLTPVFLFSGCATIGPKTIPPDRQQYVSEIAESGKEQLLLNIVKLRYLDAPTFLDVSSIINQYGLEKSVGVNGAVNYPRPATEWWNIGANSSVTVSDKPTITYTPMSGKQFTKNLLTPIPPSAVVGMIQNGWPAEIILNITVDSINGIDNYNAYRGFKQENADFQRLVQSIGSLQAAGISDIRSVSVATGEEVSMICDPTNANEKNLQDVKTLREVLKTPRDFTKFKIVYGKLPNADDELAISTRSMMSILNQYGAGIEAPEKHMQEGRARPTDTSEGAKDRMLVNIHSGSQKPADSFVSIRYRNTYYWVNDTDLKSKRNFSLLIIFLALTEVEQKSAGPLVTVGA